MKASRRHLAPLPKQKDSPMTKLTKQEQVEALLSLRKTHNRSDLHDYWLEHQHAIYQVEGLHANGFEIVRKEQEDGA